MAIEMQRSSKRRTKKKRKSIQRRMLGELLGRTPRPPPPINLNYMSSLGFIEAGDSIFARLVLYVDSFHSIGSLSPSIPPSSCFCDGHRNSLHMVSLSNQSGKTKVFISE